MQWVVLQTLVGCMYARHVAKTSCCVMLLFVAPWGYCEASRSYDLDALSDMTEDEVEEKLVEDMYPFHMLLRGFMGSHLGAVATCGRHVLTSLESQRHDSHAVCRWSPAGWPIGPSMLLKLIVFSQIAPRFPFLPQLLLAGAVPGLDNTGAPN